MGFWEEDHRSKLPFSSHHSNMCFTYDQHDLPLLILTSPWLKLLCQVPPCNEDFSLPFNTIFLVTVSSGRSAWCSFRGCKLHSLSLKAQYLHKLFGIIPHGKFISSLLLTYLFKHLFLSVWTHGSLFYTLGYNPIITYFVTLIVLSSVIGVISRGCEYMCVCVF